MTRRLFFFNFVFLCAIAATLPAQNKMLGMEEAVLKQKTSLAPDKLKELYWIKGTNAFAFILQHAKDSIFLCSSPTEKPKAAFDLRGLNASLRSNKLDTLTGLPILRWMNANEIRFIQGSRKITFNMLTKHADAADILAIPEKAENKEESPDGKLTAFTIENNLFVSDDTRLMAVTSDADKNIVNGHSVHRDEFGITKGTFWSPSGSLLAFYRMDQTMVTDYPVFDLSQRPALATLIKYPMAGDKSHEVTIGVFNPAKKTTIFLQTGEPREQYLTNIAWGPDEKHIYVAVLNRDQNNLHMNVYSAVTGAFEQTLFEEKEEKYVQPLHPIEFVRGHPELFIWQSKRNGFNNLYLYETSGKMKRQLTGTDEVDNEVTECIGFDPKGEHVFYQCVPKSNLIGRIIRKSDLSTGKCKTLSSGRGTHSAKLQPDGMYFIGTYSDIRTPRIVSVMNNEGLEQQTLLTAANPLKDFKLGKMSVFPIKASDGTLLYCRLILPVDFDSTKKYPVIDYLYGGPGVQLITDTWLAGADLWYHYMAEHGFIVFTLENRGSPNRGKAFEQVTFRHLGTVEMEDQLKGVDYLKTLAYVDKDRLGLMGWSFGGFMTTSLMTRHAGVFKTAVAGGPVIDWSYYEIMYTERYMDTPQTNKQGYAESSLLNYADKLKGKLLIIHGTSDDVVVWQHSLMFLKKCVDAGTQPDYFVYPGHFHNVLGKDRVHLFTKITDYFMQNL
jgi:dipeptidyl-peptidase-4